METHTLIVYLIKVNQPVVSNPRFDPRNSTVFPVLLGMSYLVCPRITHKTFSLLCTKNTDDP